MIEKIDTKCSILLGLKSNRTIDWQTIALHDSFPNRLIHN